MGGCERTPAILVVGAAIMCGVLAWFSWSLLAAGAGIALAVVGYPVLQRLAKRDPRMVEIAFRYFAYQRHYSAYPVARPRAHRQAGPIVGFMLLGAVVVTGLWLVAP
jgi:type IV secretory pathway TrbD component